jgi:hypothetical protein
MTQQAPNDFVPSGGPALPGGGFPKVDFRVVGAIGPDGSTPVTTSIPGNGVLTEIGFTDILDPTTQKDVSEGGICDPANNRLVIQERGLYILGMGYRWFADPLAFTQVNVQVNGVDRGPFISYTAPGTVIQVETRSLPTILNPNDFVTLAAAQGAADPAKDILGLLLGAIKFANID